jgi:hypothetical protein
MKFLLVLAGLLVAGAAGFAGAALFAPAQPAPTTPAVGPQAVNPAPVGNSPELDRRLESMAMDLADLQDQLRELRTQTSRSAVVETAAAAPTVAAAGPAPTAAQRDQILKVIEDEKAAEAARREEERLRREEKQRLQRADRMAQRFGLNEAQEGDLVDFYAASQVKFDEMRETMRLARESGTLDGESMRSSMRDMRDWAGAELERKFGPETGKQIAEYEQDRFRGWGGPDGGQDGVGANRAGRRGGGGGGGSNGGGTPGG